MTPQSTRAMLIVLGGFDAQVAAVERIFQPYFLRRIDYEPTERYKPAVAQNYSSIYLPLDIKRQNRSEMLNKAAVDFGNYDCTFVIFDHDTAAVALVSRISSMLNARLFVENEGDLIDMSSFSSINIPFFKNPDEEAEIVANFVDSKGVSLISIAGAEPHSTERRRLAMLISGHYSECLPIIYGLRRLYAGYFRKSNSKREKLGHVFKNRITELLCETLTECGLLKSFEFTESELNVTLKNDPLALNYFNGLWLEEIASLRAAQTDFFDAVAMNVKYLTHDEAHEIDILAIRDGKCWVFEIKSGTHFESDEDMGQAVNSLRAKAIHFDATPVLVTVSNVCIDMPEPDIDFRDIIRGCHISLNELKWWGGFLA